MRWLGRKIHVSWQIVAASAGLIAGVAAALLAPPSIFAGWEWLATGVAFCLIAAIKSSRWALALAAVGGGIIGMWIGSLKQIEYAAYTPYIGQTVTLEGKIAEDVTSDSDGELSMRLNSIVMQEQEFAGSGWIQANGDAPLKRGDIVTVQGRLSEGFGNLPATMFRAQLIDAERPEPGDVARQVRDWFADNVRVAIAEPQASLGVGYLVGQRSALPDALEDEFRLLGLVHLVVASGSNLIIIARLLKRYLIRVSKFTATASTLAFIGGFLLLTGFSTSMVRAALVAGLSLLAWHYGRVIHPVVLLLLAAAITLLFDPSFLWGDLGWYLSFAAFAGVILLAPLLHRYFWGDKEPGAIRYICVATVSAQLATLPIITFAFGEYSPLALVANLLVQPLVPVAMGLTFIAGIAGTLAPSLASIVGWPAEAVLTYMTSVAGWLASSPFAQGELRIGAATLTAAYVFLAGSVFCLWRRTGYRFRNSSVVD